jgi:CelD/BcsL family acetyltransferase involved in cellulose biosynthesis
VTVPWSLTTTAPGRIDTTMDIADDHDAAVTAVLAAAQAAIDDARVSATPAVRYELRAATELVAIIQTGADEDGSPDHAATSALVQRIEIERYLSALPR